MGSSQGTFFYRTFISRPTIRIRRGGCHRSSDAADSHHSRQFSGRKSSMLGRVSNNFSHSNYTDWGIAELELEDTLTRPSRYSWDMRRGHVSATALNPVLSPEKVQISSTFHTSHQMGSTGLSAVTLRPTPNTWTAPSRTVNVALQAVSRTRLHPSSASVLPQYSKRVRRISAENQSSPLPQVPDVSVFSSPGQEAWERAARKLGIPVQELGVPVRKHMSPSAYKTRASLSEVEPVSQPESFRLAASRERQPEALKVASPRRQVTSELRSMSEAEPTNSTSVEKPEAIKVKKAPARKRSTVKKSAGDVSKPKTRVRKKAVASQVEESGVLEVNGASVASLASVEGSSEEVVEQRESFTNESVLVVDSVEMATKVCDQLMGEYKDLVHACDTEV